MRIGKPGNATRGFYTVESMVVNGTPGPEYLTVSNPFFAPKGVALPVGVSVFPDELYSAPRSWAEKAYPNLIHYNRLPEGGHFAAWEQPEAFSEELRATFRSLR